jgi:hypothetical protein
VDRLAGTLEAAGETHHGHPWASYISLILNARVRISLSGSVATYRHGSTDFHSAATSTERLDKASRAGKMDAQNQRLRRDVRLAAVTQPRVMLTAGLMIVGGSENEGA